MQQQRGRTQESINAHMNAALCKLEDVLVFLRAYTLQECLNERKLQLYQTCSARAESMASETSSASTGRLLSPLRQKATGALAQLWKVRPCVCVHCDHNRV